MAAGVNRDDDGCHGLVIGYMQLYDCGDIPYMQARDIVNSSIIIIIYHQQ